MSDTPPTGDAPAMEPSTNQPTLKPHVDTPPATDDEPLGDQGKKALASERKARLELEAKLKELEPLAEEARKRADAEKTEAQRLNEALAGERDARTKAEAALLRYTVGADKGVPPKLIGFLSGSTQEEVEQAADALLAELGDKRPAMPTRPAERMATGRPSKNQLEGLDPLTLIRMGRGEDVAQK